MIAILNFKKVLGTLFSTIKNDCKILFFTNLFLNVPFCNSIISWKPLHGGSLLVPAQCAEEGEAETRPEDNYLWGEEEIGKKKNLRNSAETITDLRHKCIRVAKDRIDFLKLPNRH